MEKFCASFGTVQWLVILRRRIWLASWAAINAQCSRMIPWRRLVTAGCQDFLVLLVTVERCVISMTWRWHTRHSLCLRLPRSTDHRFSLGTVDDVVLCTTYDVVLCTTLLAVVPPVSAFVLNSITISRQGLIFVIIRAEISSRQWLYPLMRGWPVLKAKWEPWWTAATCLQQNSQAIPAIMLLWSAKEI